MRVTILALACAAAFLAEPAAARGPDFARLERTVVEELEQTRTPGR